MSKDIEILTKKLDEQSKKENKLSNFIEILDGLTSTEEKKNYYGKKYMRMR